MNKYEERITKLERHLSVHPADYQTVISLLKLRSVYMVARRLRHWHSIRQRIAEIKRSM